MEIIQAAAKIIISFFLLIMPSNQNSQLPVVRQKASSTVSSAIEKKINQPTTKNEPSNNIRKPAVAGRFYAASKENLVKQVRNFLGKNDPTKNNIKAIIVPHAGYMFSGKVAGSAFSALNKNYNKVILIGPSHYSRFSSVSVGDFSHYQTPLGNVKVSADAKKMVQEKDFSFVENAHQKEHALEVELPFLQHQLNNFEIIPLLVGGSTSFNQIIKISNTLKKYIDDKTLIVASVDFTHFGTNYNYTPFAENISENIKKLDDTVLELLGKFSTQDLFNYLKNTATTNDGKIVLPIISELFKNSNLTVEVAARDTSGNILNDYTNSVSYVGATISSKKEQHGEYSKQERNYLLQLARTTLTEYYQDKTKIEVAKKDVPKNLQSERGVFVTLNKNHNLRGCIGNIPPVKPIYQAVIDNAVNAAVNDARFTPVTKGELSKIDIEVSILSLPKEVSVKNYQEYFVKIGPNIDGVVIEQGDKKATFLPQVWKDLKTHESFLGQLCKKAGLDGECWKDSDTKISTYQAEVFSESGE